MTDHTVTLSVRYLPHNLHHAVCSCGYDAFGLSVHEARGPVQRHINEKRHYQRAGAA